MGGNHTDFDSFFVSGYMAVLLEKYGLKVMRDIAVEIQYDSVI